MKTLLDGNTWKLRAFKNELAFLIIDDLSRKLGDFWKKVGPFFENEDILENKDEFQKWWYHV